MKAPIIWLKDFTDIDVEPKTLADMMTMTGSKVEEVITTGDDIDGVYTGKILEVAEHPDSDHLHVLKVDLGSDELGRDLQIVCGAPNVYVGMICPVAIVGAHLPGGVHIKKGKLRGVESFGMCCAADELGVSPEGHPGAEEYGLWNMPKDTPLGVDIKTLLGLGAVTIDFEITSNRPDCFSIEGLGREAAVTLGKPFKPVDPKLKLEGKLDINSVAKVDIEDPDLCYRYTSRLVEDVKIGPSPAWMADKLTQAGMRPINNIVDITNYVCLELGQPMHAFDLNYLEGNHVIVRRAKDGEQIKTLDGQDHTLDSSMLVIADEKKACAIAGVMGGENSEVLPETTTILFESAVFNGVSVRRTAISNGLRTEASSRYEKGLDPENALRALDRACELVEMLGCGKVSQGFIDNYPTKKGVNHIPFRPEKINNFIGIEATEEFMRKTLSDLGCTFAEENGISVVIPPTFRPDLEGEADISEEVARFFGYNKIEATLLSGKETTLGGRTPEQQTIEKIRNTLVYTGFFEAITYSFESPSDLDSLNVPSDSYLRNQLKISNPLGDDTSVMRTTMLPSMLKIASRNANRGVSEAKVFEVAYVYLPQEGEQLPSEKRTLSGFAYKPGDSADTFFDVKSDLEELFKVTGIRSYEFEPLTDNASFHPGRTASVIINGKKAGVLGVIHPDAASNFEAPEGTVAFEIDCMAIVNAAKSARVYKSLPRFPGITRDLALICKREVTVSEIMKTAKSSGGKYLKDVKLFDIYQDDKLGLDLKSVAISLVFRADDKTLSDDDIRKDVDGIVEKLSVKLGAKLRS